MARWQFKVMLRTRRSKNVKGRARTSKGGKWVK
jgi:hypothetical protein